MRSAKYFYISLFYFILLFLTTFGVSGQNKKWVLDKKPRLYFCMNDLGPVTIALSKQYGVLNSKLVGIQYTTDSSTMSFQEDTGKLFKLIRMLFPNKEDKGIGILDLEGTPREVLKYSSEKDTAYINAYNLFYRILATVKSYRPNVYWGYYALPFTLYWNRDQNWKNTCFKILPLLKQCDILFPSQYCFYPESFLSNAEHDYVSDNISFALQLGQELNRPVMPFVWHRYHPSNKKVAFQLIPIEDFKKQIEYILNVKYENRKVQGIIWWGSDIYYFNNRTPALLTEAKNKKTFESYHDSLIVEYENQILPLFKE
jgi:hypothetical protein